MALSDSVTITWLLATAKGQLDRLVSPEHQQQAYALVLADRPLLLQTLITTTTTFASIPILLFLGYALGTFLIHAGTALLSFAFWFTSGLALLVPTVILAVALAVGVWFWAVVAFLVGRWFYDSFFVRAASRGPGSVTTPSRSPLKSDMRGM